MDSKLTLISELNCLTLEDLADIRKALNESYKYLENAIKNVNIINEEIYYIFRQSEIQRQERFVKVGVYLIKKGKKESLIYHIVDDKDYIFQDTINSCWSLQYEYELEVNKPLKINRFIVDIDYWISNNCYSLN